MSLDSFVPGALYLPDVGLTSSDERAAAAAVREYDESLQLGFRKDAQEWVIFMEHNGEPFPVLGLGRSLPSPDLIKRRMYETDIRRHGDKIFHKIQRHNDLLQAEQKAALDEKVGIAAEHLDHAFRKEGVHPTSSIFVPGSYRRKGD